MEQSIDVILSPDKSRYEVLLDGRMIGYMDMVPKGDTTLIPYIFVEPAHRGKDIANRLLRHALQDLRDQGQKVIPICPYVAAFLKRNKEFDDILGVAAS